MKGEVFGIPPPPVYTDNIKARLDAMDLSPMPSLNKEDDDGGEDDARDNDDNQGDGHSAS